MTLLPILKLPSIRLIIFLIPFYLFLSCGNETNSVSNRKVFIQNKNGKYTLVRDGKPYHIKGAAGQTNLKKLQQIGGNTIRTYDTLNLKAILDDARQHNITVMVGLPLPESRHSEFVYDQPKAASRLVNEYTKLILKYKDHPAVLMWCVGNELDFSPKPKYYNFYRTFNSIVQMIHREDPDHPVTTTMVNLRPKNLFCISLFTDIDVLSTNVFISLNKMKDELEQVSWFWKGPFIISEWGIEGPWLKKKNAWGAYLEENSTQKARHYQDMNSYIPQENPRFLGAFVFYWGSKQETTHTWFSMLDENGRESEAVGVMEKIWTGKNTRVTPPQITGMLLNNKANANVIFKPGGIAQATLILQKTDTTFHTVWEVFPEDWFLPKNEKNTKKLKALPESVISSGLNQASFRIPKKEGPYRVFATVYDQHGNFASCNIPFYVVNN